MKWNPAVKKTVPLLMLLVFASICFFSQASESVTVDEFNHLPSGIYNLVTLDWRMDNESPPLVKCFFALSFLITNPQIDYKSFEKSPNPWSLGYSFMFLNKDRYPSIFQAGRCFVIILGCLLGWLIYIWARELYGDNGALFALFLYICNPNILAHSSLTTVDVGASMLILLSIYCFWKYLKDGGWRSIVLAGAALGLAQLGKFTALLLYPIFTVVILSEMAIGANAEKPAGLRRTWTTCIKDFCIMILISVVVINAGYLFSGSFKPLSEYRFSSDLFRAVFSLFWNGLAVPLPYDYLTGLDMQMSISAGGNPFYASYLMGEHSLRGWWYYYIVAFLVKNPLSLLFMLLLAVVVWVRHKKSRPDKLASLCIWIPVICYFVYFSFFTHISIGIRHLLPIFPLLFLACGLLFHEFILERRYVKTALAVLMASYLFSAACVFPDYLSYFNIAAGGSQNGYRWLIDSNLDWGQNLPGLKSYMDRSRLDKIKMGYFGRVDPKIYGIDYSLAEKNPQEGVYAISINFLVGRPYYLLKEERPELIYADLNYYERYRTLKPTAVIGNTIYIFDMRKGASVPLPSW
ncbi:MAG: hypothetical protein CSYNP_04394 [Syntrophus sp. SKADARSKE-3]|nr:hypothetical protein [Syntrophus sp. SKADARSKE-3]